MLDQILKCWAIEFGQNTELAVKHLLSRASRQFLDLLLRVVRDPNDYTSICKKGLGNWLAAHRGEAAGGWRLESRTVNHQCAWRIVEAPFPQAPNLVDLLGYDQRHVARQSVPEPLAPVSSGSSTQSRFHAIVESMEAEFETSWQSLSTVERQHALTALAQAKQFEVLLSAHVVQPKDALDHKHNSLVASTAQSVLANSLKADENSFKRAERKSHYEEIKAAMEGIRQSKRRSVHRTAPQARIAPSRHAAAQCRRRRLIH
jgi:hypothetical protein